MRATLRLGVPVHIAVSSSGRFIAYLGTAAVYVTQDDAKTLRNTEVLAMVFGDLTFAPEANAVLNALEDQAATQ